MNGVTQIHLQNTNPGLDELHSGSLLIFWLLSIRPHMCTRKERTTRVIPLRSLAALSFAFSQQIDIHSYWDSCNSWHFLTFVCCFCFAGLVWVWLHFNSFLFEWHLYLPIINRLLTVLRMHVVCWFFSFMSFSMNDCIDVGNAHVDCFSEANWWAMMSVR